MTTRSTGRRAGNAFAGDEGRSVESPMAFSRLNGTDYDPVIGRWSSAGRRVPVSTQHLPPYHDSCACCSSQKSPEVRPCHT